MLHRTRRPFVRQHPTLIDAPRVDLAEFGFVAGVGRDGLKRSLKVIEDGEDDRTALRHSPCRAQTKALQVHAPATSEAETRRHKRRHGHTRSYAEWPPKQPSG